MVKLVITMKQQSQISNQKTISTEQLTHYESGYCITIHKSQGSEYDHIAIILPDKQNQILSKELLYTAVTRAKSVLIEKTILKQCISKIDKKIWTYISISQLIKKGSV